MQRLIKHIKTLTKCALILTVLVMLFLGPIVATPVQAFGDLGGGASTASEIIKQKPKVDTLSCDGLSTFDICISNVFYWMFPGLTSYIAYIAAVFFDLLAHLSINGLAYALSFIKDSWEIARDIANMLFFFIIVVIAANIVFNADIAGSKKMLATMIMMALLVNFSLFITRTVVDVGNLFGAYFYNSITSAPALSSPTTNSTTGMLAAATGEVKDLTSPLMQAVNPQGLTSDKTFAKWRETKSGFASSLVLIVIYIMSGLIYLLLTVMFVTAGVKFALRIVTLWMVIILSPLAFAAKTFTVSDKMGGAGALARRGYTMWQEGLVQFSLYPAMFFFVYFIVVSVSNGILCGKIGVVSDCSLASSMFASANTTTDSVVSTIASTMTRMALVIILLYYALKASQSMVSAGNQISGAVGSKVLGGFAKVIGRVPYAGARAATWAAGAVLNTTPITRNLGNKLKDFSSGNTLKKIDPTQSKTLNAAGSSINRLLFDRNSDTGHNTDSETKKAQVNTAKDAAKRDSLIKRVSSQKPEEVSDSDRAEIESLDNKTVASLDTKQIQSIAHHLTEKQHEAIQSSDRPELTAEVKKGVKSQWHHGAAQKVVKQLRSSGLKSALESRVGATGIFDKNSEMSFQTAESVHESAKVLKQVGDKAYATAEKEEVATLSKVGATDKEKSDAAEKTKNAAEKQKEAVQALTLAERLTKHVAEIPVNVGGVEKDKTFKIS